MSLHDYITTLSRYGTHRTGSKVFEQTVNDALADYVPCVRSFGASR